MQQLLKKMKYYHKAQDELLEGMDMNSSDTEKTSLIRNLLLADDYADAPRLRTKYFWNLYGGVILMDPDVAFDIDNDPDTIIDLGKYINKNS
jgi:hypothetical protein